MATESTFVWDESFQAGADLSSLQFYIVKSTAKDTVALCTGSSAGAAGPLGVLQNAPTSVGPAQVRLLGMTKLSAGGAISVGDFVTATTGGQGLAATAALQKCIGIANSATTTVGHLIEVRMFGPVIYST